ncbi:MAG: hypothetical protein K6B67_03245 [Lachnospiraceae bacterium]|nr:hypothetical protein [Lachnospiraceae bacterium]
MSSKIRFISRKKLIYICIILIFVCFVGYVFSMKNPFFNAFIINAKYYKEDSYQEKIVIDGIVYCDINENVITISELEEKGVKISGFDGDFSRDVKINDDIEVTVFDDGEVYVDGIKNVQNHNIYIYGITEESDYYDLLKLYGLFLYDDAEHDVARYGIKRDAYNSDISRKILRHEDFTWDNSLEMWNYYDLFGDCIVDVMFENDQISEIELMKLTDL